MTTSAPATKATTSKKAIAGGGKRKNPPTVVSPTPTPEQIGVLATALVKKSSNNASRKKKNPATAKHVRHSKKEPPVKDMPLTVGHHNEIYDNGISNCSGCRKTKRSSSSSILSSQSSLSLSASSAIYPPLMSRYCAGCGDILSTKAYGFDEEHRDRRYRFHPEDGFGTDRERIRDAAESVKQRFLKVVKGNETNGSDKVSSSRSTKASRKKKKAAKDQEEPHHEFLKSLPPWPDESLRMDMTIIEGLMSLKNTPRDEVDCRCWNGGKSGVAAKASKRGLVAALATSKSPSPNAKKKPKAAKVPSSSKIKTIVKKKPPVTKGSGSLTTNNPEVISSKTVIVKCPKTGKKIKKTIRTVKKLVKKKRVLPKSLGTASLVGSSKGDLPPTTTLSVTSPTGNPMNSSTPGNGGDKENSGTPEGASNGSKKRVRDEGLIEEDDESASEDGSDDDGSSLKKRRRNDEKVDLDLRERLLNCPLENGPYYPSHQELMELTTIRKRNALQTFYKRFNELRQFIAIFGDANVPQQFPENHSLGIWVNKMRMERKKWDTGSERTSLTERKIELLESIDFIWAQNHKGEIGWERRFQEIKKFKRKHGHCNVPTKSAENRALGRWVSTQRTMYKNYMKGFVGKSLTREEQERRIFLLLKEGFLFSMIPNGQSPGGTGEASGEGTVPSDLMGADMPSVARVETAETSRVSNPLDGSKMDGTVTVDTVVSATTQATPTTLSSSATNTLAKASGSMEPTAPSTTTEVNDSRETVKKGPNLDATAMADDTGVKKEDGRNDTGKKIVPSLPSQPDSIKSEAVTSSPPSSRAPSIAQISVSTTPTTTPSVSTTPSPDRSPKPIPMHDEPDCMTKIESVVEEEELTRDKTEDDKIPVTNEMPVVPSLKNDSAVLSRPTKGEADEDHISSSENLSSDSVEASRPDQTSTMKIGVKLEIVSTMRSTMIASSEKTASISPTPEAQPQEDKERQPLQEETDIDKSPPESDSQIPKNEEASVNIPSTPPEIERTISDFQFLEQKPLVAKEEPPVAKAPQPPAKTSTLNDTLQTAAEEPKLVTSEGMRITVTMNDPEYEMLKEPSSGSRKNGSSGGISSLSPSRRSVRARKPSARQIEAEKSPLHESILGR